MLGMSIFLIINICSLYFFREVEGHSGKVHHVQWADSYAAYNGVYVCIRFSEFRENLGILILATPY